jgi:hypothetical protein
VCRLQLSEDRSQLDRRSLRSPCGVVECSIMTDVGAYERDARSRYCEQSSAPSFSDTLFELRIFSFELGHLSFFSTLWSVNDIPCFSSLG